MMRDSNAGWPDAFPPMMPSTEERRVSVKI